ncbi:hypothetical protein BDY19DRAFT_663704 [Irpex rosettiformis]|uniref:Uncharacterized protein n=1 Tax=Irpex rosettiformis TaxID=378272 RepID=A0ACB8UAB4_9APHY|nr:hypothetical protein BDY19DRAFT_663704 [Irpex rosettiformis]
MIATSPPPASSLTPPPLSTPLSKSSTRHTSVANEFEILFQTFYMRYARCLQPPVLLQTLAYFYLQLATTQVLKLQHYLEKKPLLHRHPRQNQRRHQRQPHDYRQHTPRHDVPRKLQPGPSFHLHFGTGERVQARDDEGDHNWSSPRDELQGEKIVRSVVVPRSRHRVRARRVSRLSTLESPHPLPHNGLQQRGSSDWTPTPRSPPRH